MNRTIRWTLVTALATPTMVLAAHSAAHTNYQHCVSQKRAAAQYYCNKASKDCSAQLKAAAHECRAEVKEGLRFKNAAG